MNHKQIIPCLLFLLIHTQSFSMDQRSIHIENFHNECNRGNTEKVLSLLQQDNSLVNATNKFSHTALHMACKNHQPAIVSILLEQNSIKPNTKNNYGTPPLHLALEAPLDNPDTMEMIHFLMSNKKINVHKGNDYNQTFFYCAYTNRKLSEAYQNHFNDAWGNNNNLCNQLIENLNPQQKKCFMTEELHQASLLCTSMPAGLNNERSVTTNVSSFIAFCLDHQGDINARDTNGRRPVDKAYTAYTSAPKYPDFPHQEIIYHAFLRHTPSIPDTEIHYLFWKQQFPYDICAKIMGYYVALTIEKELVNRIDENLERYPYANLCPTEKKRTRKKILTEKCNKLGYINPTTKN